MKNSSNPSPNHP